MTELVLNLRELTKSFGGRPVLDRVTLGLKEGTIYSLVGPNGSGKTTLLNLVCGLLRQDSGLIELRGQDLTNLPVERRADAGLGRVFQTARVFGQLSVLDNLLVAFPRNPGNRVVTGLTRFAQVGVAEREHRSQAERYLRAVGLDNRAQQWAERLSFGEKKLVAIGRVLMANRNVLLLDEIFAGVSETNRTTLKRLLKEQAERGTLIVLVEHDQDLLSQVVDSEIRLSHGKARMLA